MSQVTNSLLGLVQKLIGGAPGSGVTNLDDENLTQVLPIVPDIGRRGLTIGNIGGWHVGILENGHAGDDGEVSSILPYRPADDNVAPYPSPVPDGFDVWLLGIAGRRVSGTGTLAGADMGLNVPTAGQGWGVDDEGASVLATPIIQLAKFDGIDTSIGPSNDPMITEGGQYFVRVGLRVPRGGTLVFASESGGAAAVVFHAMFVLGLFPAGLGQDVVT